MPQKSAFQTHPTTASVLLAKYLMICGDPQLALAHAKTAHPPLFLLGDVEVPSPVLFVGVVREDKRKEMRLSVAAPALVYFLAAAYGLSSREQSYAGWGFSI